MKNRRTSAFTLIELLVVIAIIALLLAILLPSLEAARRQGKKAACISHIKNIATSSLVYASDDPQGWGIPAHHLQFNQDPQNPTFVGAYEYGGKSGIGKQDFTTGGGSGQYAFLNSKYGTRAGFGPSTRPLNDILYPSGFKDNLHPTWDRIGAENDTKLNLDLFKCAGDDGPPRGAHCQDWIDNPERSSFDNFGTSYAANIFLTGLANQVGTNSPYLRPTTRVPTPSRTILYEENIGRWAWAARRDECPIAAVQPGVDPGPNKAIRGWHGSDWTFNRSFTDSHAESQKVYFEGTEDSAGYAIHYVAEHITAYPPWFTDGPGDPPSDYERYKCIIVRGPGWQKDTLPAPVLDAGISVYDGARPSYEDCVDSQ